MQDSSLNGIKLIHIMLRITDIGLFGIVLLRQDHDILPKKKGFQQLHLVTFSQSLAFDAVQRRSRRGRKMVLRVIVYPIPTGLIINLLSARRLAQKHT